MLFSARHCAMHKQQRQTEHVVVHREVLEAQHSHKAYCQGPSWHAAMQLFLTGLQDILYKCAPQEQHSTWSWDSLPGIGFCVARCLELGSQGFQFQGQGSHLSFMHGPCLSRSSLLDGQLGHSGCPAQGCNTSILGLKSSTPLLDSSPFLDSL